MAELMGRKLEKTLTATEWIGIILIVLIILPGTWKWVKENVIVPQSEAIRQIEQLQNEVDNLERIIKQ